MRAAVIVAVLIVTTLAHAEPPGLTPPLEPARPSQPLRRTKERSTATIAALGGTLTPFFVMLSIGNAQDPGSRILLFGATAVLLPSAGHWYAGKFFTTGMGIRVASALVATLSLSVLVQSDGGGIAEEGLVFGLLGLGVGAGWDIATAGSAVDDWNRAHAVEIAPTAMKVGNGYGVGLVGRF